MAHADTGSNAPPAERQAGETIGRREAHKRATRQALQDAADRLYAERGVLHTTVRDIADAAGVTERTFFRYFKSKEDLLTRDAFAWMPAFQQAVLARPADEPPLLAVRRALATFTAAVTRVDAASPLALFAAGPPAEQLGLTALAIMRKLETDLADAIEPRIVTSAPARNGKPSASARFEAEVVARTALAVFRSVMLHNSELDRDDVTNRPALSQLLDQAFDAINEQPPRRPQTRRSRPARMSPA